jgi:hypothetical protein
MAAAQLGADAVIVQRGSIAISTGLLGRTPKRSGVPRLQILRIDLHLPPLQIRRTDFDSRNLSFMSQISITGQSSSGLHDSIDKWID